MKVYTVYRTLYRRDIMKLKKLSSIIIACGLFMTGCTGATTENGGSNASESSSASYPMTISHA